MKISVGSYNIYHGENKWIRIETGDKIIDLKETAKTIAALDVDLCGLNEVRNQWGEEGLCNQAEVIARELGWHFYFAKAIDFEGSGPYGPVYGPYGNGFLSKFPLLSHVSTRIPPRNPPHTDSIKK